MFKVYDKLRKNFFVLTEEEFIRQIFVAWLTDHLGYPPSLMANEIGINLNETYKRCDTVIFLPDGSPLMIIEYKSPKVNLSQEVFNQIVRYNMVLKAEYLVVSNGCANYCCKVDYTNNRIICLNNIPEFKDIVRKNDCSQL